jgi:DNA-binding Xre family transcriptional regulator
MKNRGVSQYKLIKDYHFSTGQLDRLRKNESVSTHTLDILCQILDCKIEEVAVYLEDETESSD